MEKVFKIKRKKSGKNTSKLAIAYEKTKKEELLKIAKQCKNNPTILKFYKKQSPR